ncbi:hypothetical protein BaRGS_00024411 [Batillaria attramentaria]|uniref:Uncharacterized protein n=1 Tax=Batillaria attramentaria TaxID=370345 RepID=A0ABD0KAY7_9CAEN
MNQEITNSVTPSTGEKAADMMRRCMPLRVQNALTCSFSHILVSVSPLSSVSSHSGYTPYKPPRTQNSVSHREHAFMTTAIVDTCKVAAGGVVPPVTDARSRGSSFALRYFLKRTVHLILN